MLHCRVVSPEDSRALWAWDFLMFGTLVLVAVLTPFEVAFLYEDLSFAELGTVGRVRFWVNRCVDSLFIADMVLQFFVMYPVPHKHGVTYVREPRLIARHYLARWFPVDLLSVLPFDVVGMAVESSSIAKLRVLKVVRLLRLLKLVRLLRGMRILHRWQLEMSFSHRRTTQWQLLFVVCVASHWISCFLGIMATFWGPPCAIAQSPEMGCSDSWMSGWVAGELEEQPTPGALELYLVTLHVAATVIVHPHAGKPTTSAERACFILLIFIGGFIWTRVISRTTAMQTSLDRHTIFYKQTMDDLNSSSRALGLSSELRRRLRGFFIAGKQGQRDLTWRELTRRMSPALRADVACELHRAWLRRIPYLVGVSKVFILHLAPMIRKENFAQNELFGDNFTLYILQQGLCGSGRDKKMKVLRPGAVWGTEHLLLNMWYLLRPNTARALSFIEVMSLTREDFWQVCKDHPENRHKLRKHFVWYAVTRGIVFYAQQRRREESEGLQRLTHQTHSFDSHSEQYNHHIRRARKELTKKTRGGSAFGAEAFGGEASDDAPPRLPSPREASTPSSPGRSGRSPAVPPVLLGKLQRERSLCKSLSGRSSRAWTSVARLPSVREPRSADFGSEEWDQPLDVASLDVAAPLPESTGRLASLAQRRAALSTCREPALLEAVEDRLSRRIDTLAEQLAQLRGGIELLLAREAGGRHRSEHAVAI